MKTSPLHERVMPWIDSMRAAYDAGHKEDAFRRLERIEKIYDECGAERPATLAELKRALKKELKQ
jgi:hypothetical protein